jgi:fibronectin-binding autotransporter adhesin
MRNCVIRPGRCHGMALVGAVVLMLTAPGNAPAASGALTQLAAPDGCVAELGDGIQCRDGNGLDGASGVALSNDGKHVYVASAFSDAVTVFSPDRITGVLTQLAGTDGCTAESGDGITCADGKALDGANSVIVSPDGNHVYVTSSILGSGGIAAFARNRRTGVLTQLSGADGCISETGNLGACANGVAVNNACSLAMSPDGRHVYVTTCMSDAVTVFVRNRRTGVLTQLAGPAGCIKESGDGVECADGKGLDGAISVAVSPDGKHVYVASFFGDAVAIFARNRTTGALTQLAGPAGCIKESGDADCADGRGLDGAAGVAVSRDGKHVYVASSSSQAVAIFARDRRTGALAQLAGPDGCVKESGDGIDCAEGKGLAGARGVLVSADGKHVYVASRESDAVAAFSRNRTTGALTQLADLDGCVSDTGSAGNCAVGAGLDGARFLAAPRTGKYLYVTSDGSDAIAVFARER